MQSSRRCFWVTWSGIAIHFTGTGWIFRTLHLVRKKLCRHKSWGRELCMNRYLMRDSTAVAFIQEGSCMRESEYYSRVLPGPPHCWCTIYWARERSWSFLVESMSLGSATCCHIEASKLIQTEVAFCGAQCSGRRNIGVGLTLLFRRPHSLTIVLRRWGLYRSQA